MAKIDPVVVRIKAGDTEAYRQLFREYYPSVLAFVNGFVKDRSAAEDISQDIFIKVWIYRMSMDPEKPVRSYLFLIAKRHITNWFRKNQIIQNLVAEVPGHELEKLEDITAENDGIEELRLMAGKVVTTMPFKRRQVFMLSKREGLSAEEIGMRLGISPRTVNKHIQLALRHIRSEIKKERII